MSMSPAMSMVCTGSAKFSRRSKLLAAERLRAHCGRRLLVRVAELRDQALPGPGPLPAG